MRNPSGIEDIPWIKLAIVPIILSISAVFLIAVSYSSTPNPDADQVLVFVRSLVGLLLFSYVLLSLLIYPNFEGLRDFLGYHEWLVLVSYTLVWLAILWAMSWPVFDSIEFQRVGVFGRSIPNPNGDLPWWATGWFQWSVLIMLILGASTSLVLSHLADTSRIGGFCEY